MPEQVSYPGVYIQEVSSGSRTITGVSTSVALFIGMAQQGPMDKPIRILSYTEFERTFGTANESGELHDQVKQFFLNGGSTAWVMRIAKSAAPATVLLKSEDATGSDVLEISAADYGTLGASIRLRCDYDTAEPESTFNLLVEQLGLDSGGNTVITASELHKNLSMNPNSNRYVVTALEQQSALIRATVQGTPTAKSAYSWWGVWEAADNTTVNLLGTFPGSSTEGKFRISVDGSPFVTVTLDDSMTTRALVETAIKNALMPVGKNITLTQPLAGGVYVWEVRSTETGGFVTFASADDLDIAVAAQMGTANGGIDVGGWAHMRPAPNGLFGQLRVDTPATLQTNLGGWIGLAQSAIDTFTINDSATTPAIDLSPDQPTAVATNFTDLRTTLNSIVAQINASTAPWSAVRHGYRLVLTPTSDSSNAESGAYVTTGVLALDADYFWDTGTGNVPYYQLGSFGTAYGSFQNGTSGGSNGLTPESDEYDAAYEIADRDIDLFNILVLPRSGDQNDAARALLWGPASVFAKNSRAIVLIDPDSTWVTANDVVDASTGVTSLRVGVAKDYAAVYWPRIKVADGTTLQTIDPSGAVAGVMARIDVSRGVWKAPAGLEASLLGVRGVEHAMSDAENGLVNPEAVNAIRAFPNGIVSWGARTMDGFDNSGNDDYKYLPIRRLALYIEESLYRGLKWAVFEPNDEPLWRQLRQAAGAFMNNLFRLGAFAGAKASQAYFVKVDKETTTQNDINLGIVNVVVGFAPLKPAEFVVITLQQQAGEVQT
jgi:phage tail sheath protein FI